MKLLPALAVALFSWPAAFAQAARLPGVPAEKAGAYASFDCVNLLDSTGVEVNENGSGTFTIRKIVRVQTPAGAMRYRIVKYDYDPLTAFAEFTRVTVRKADGKTIPVDIRTACDYAAPARSIYWGARQIMLELGRLDPGDVIDYEISKKGFTYALLSATTGNGGACSAGVAASTAAGNDEDRFIPPMKGQFYDIVPFWVTDPTLRKVYRVALPKDKEVQYEFYQGACSSSIRTEGNRRICTFAVDNAMPFRREPNMVDLFDAAPKLMLSTTAGWKDKSLWFYGVNEDYGSFDPLPEAQAKVNSLIKGCKTEMEKIAVLTHWVADNMRYSGISMGKGEGYTLHNTRMNFTDRCGVCKDKAALLISMLRMAGFEAYPAMTMAGSRIESIPADHFNHCVAVVKLSDGTYMPLDPTWVPFVRELWSSAEQQQHYLPGIPEGSDLCLTPVSPPENHYFRIQADSEIDREGNLCGTFVLTAEGQSDAAVRRIFTNSPAGQWRNAIERELQGLSPNARLLRVDYGKDPRDYQAGPIRISVKYEIPGYALPGKNTLAFRPVVLNRLFSGPCSYLRIDLSPEERKYGFKDACSRLVELEETVRIPKGYRLSVPVRTEEKRDQAADFYGYVRQENDRIQVYQKLTLRKRVYDAADWPGFRNAVGAHRSFCEQPLFIRR